ncbi:MULTISPECIES: SSI family serine proteinase inhibitor [unclassified Nocardiopsis]|uniref:SSI family serine proteinase inhibitor n=1 Tax=unclassified Nocardiopsis TaxID=2649073 RepID=UPI00135C1A70|nr:MULTISPECIES: SSI family serine proteinase inhibitor [unclassified Nocardiopsis]
MKHTALALVAAPALVLALGAPVQAAPFAAEQRHVLFVQKESEDWARQAILECGPAGGTHPRAEDACAAIAEAGSIADIRSTQRLCPLVYDPVIATAYGDDGIYHETFANQCVLLSEKGPVFDF